MIRIKLIVLDDVNCYICLNNLTRTLSEIPKLSPEQDELFVSYDEWYKPLLTRSYAMSKSMNFWQIH